MADKVKPLVLLGEAFGANEVRTKTAFVGSAGIELLRMLDESGLISLTAEDHSFIQRFWTGGGPELIDMIWRMHPELHRTNVFNLHPHSNDITNFCGGKADAIPGYPALVKGKFVRAEYQTELDRLADELLALDPNLVLCLGNTPLWALAGTTGVSKLRGTTRLSTHCVTGYKLLGTYHPAAVLRQWELRPTVIADFIKAAREREYPEVRRPEREVWIEPTLEDLYEFRRQFIDRCQILSVDIETAGTRVTCIGFAPSASRAIVIPFDDGRRKDRNYWPSITDESRAWCFVREILMDASIRKVFQNGAYDISFLWRSVGIPVFGAEHDTMILHHALQPESLKSLGFLGSIYSSESAWKTERKGTKTIKRDE